MLKMQDMIIKSVTRQLGDQQYDGGISNYRRWWEAIKDNLVSLKAEDITEMATQERSRRQLRNVQTKPKQFDAGYVVTGGV